LERELVVAARSGDEAAFARLLEREAARTFRAVLAVVRSPEDAEEVVQDASVSAWRHISGLRDEDRWAAWYRRIAVHEALDRAGRRPRLREISIDAPAGLADGVGATRDPTDGWDDRMVVLQALGGLSADDRAVLGLRFGADLEVPDVAAALGIPLGTAKSRLHRAIGRLAPEMGEHDGDR